MNPLLPKGPFAVLDWIQVQPTEHPGTTGLARWQTIEEGGARVRIVDYSPGYLADHWCERGHVVHVLEGELVTELRDGREFVLQAGQSYRVGQSEAPHRSRSPKGAKLFIVDRSRETFEMPSAEADGYTISSDASRLDLDVIHGFLSTDSYWAQGISRERVRRSIENSLCFGVYLAAAQVGFARVITDRASFAYLCDVFILAPHRGKGLGRRLLEAIHAHPELAGLRRWLLATKDAHGLYAKLGWKELQNPGRFMEMLRPYDSQREAPPALQ